MITVMPTIPGATLRDLERYAIEVTLAHVGGSTSKAAAMLGVSPRKVQYRLAEYRNEARAEAQAIHDRKMADQAEALADRYQDDREEGALR